MSEDMDKEIEETEDVDGTVVDENTEEESTDDEY